MTPTETGQSVARYQSEVTRYSGLDIRDEQGRWLAGPQTILPTREPGPWNSNADQRAVEKVSA